jgi:hypothetical protein
MKRPLMMLLISGLALTWACGGEGQDGETMPGSEAEPRDAFLDEDPISSGLLEMPDFPAQQRGRMVAVSIGAPGGEEMDGSWEAGAAMCEDPPMMQVMAGEPGIGTLVLLQLPPAAERVGRYPIVITESGAPPAPAAQIGIQLFRDPASYAYQAMDGEVEVYGYGDRVSARFAATMREIQSNDTVMYAGVFHGVTLQPLPVEQCAAAKAALEELDAAADTAEAP